MPGGIRLREAVSALAPLAADARLAALELVEYDPSRDPGRITAAAAEAVLGALTGAGARPAALRKAA